MASNNTHLLLRSFHWSERRPWLIYVPSSWTVFSPGYSTGGKSTFKFLQIVDRIHFLAVVWVRVQTSLLAVSWSLPSGARGHLYVSAVWLLYRQFTTTTWHLVSSRPTGGFVCLPSAEKSLIQYTHGSHMSSLLKYSICQKKR